MKLLALYAIFFRFGLICFGGGNVLTPVFIEELVEARQWMTLDEFGNLLAIAQITPGPISINAATFFGYRHAGIPGAVVATAGILTPSFLLVTLALRTLQRQTNRPWVRGLMWGVGPATIALLVAATVIFFEMTVLTGPIPWASLFKAPAFQPPDWPDGLRVRPFALLLCAGSGLALWREAISPTKLILLCAVLGAVVFPLLG
ncbi:MAG: chromate transporter [Kiritimatiellia bacterium]|jgi:chromate transporter